jgi:GNAT superfamily N-acetyltransferase
MTDDLLEHVEVIPAAPSHFAWMLSTFQEQIALLPLTPWSVARAQGDALARILRGGLGRSAVVVPRGEEYHGDTLGWAAALDGRILFAYVREPLRRQGFGAQLITSLTNLVPVPVAYWTPEIEQVAAHGFPVCYDIHAFRALCSYVRRGPRHHQTERAHA